MRPSRRSLHDDTCYAGSGLVLRVCRSCLWMWVSVACIIYMFGYPRYNTVADIILYINHCRHLKKKLKRWMRASMSLEDDIAS